MASSLNPIESLEDVESIDCVIKLGGSALTDKQQKETFNDDLFEPTLDCIIECCERFKLENGRPLRLVLIHGAGSFAHPHAKAGKVHLGFSDVATSTSVVHGFCDTRLGLHKLSSRILEHLISKKLPVSLSSVFPGWKTSTVYENEVKKTQEIVTHTCKVLREVVDLGVIPVLHGDCVLDVRQHTAVLSGDLILDTIAREMRPNYVVYVSDVAGVYDQPPTKDGQLNASAVVVPEISVQQDGSFQMPGTSVSCIDVSGGMAGKISAAAATASRGIPVYIVKGGTRQMVEACVGRAPSIGTVIKLAD